MHEVLVNRLGGLSLPRKSVVRLTDRPDMTLDVYRGRKTTIQQKKYNIYLFSILNYKIELYRIHNGQLFYAPPQEGAGYYVIPSELLNVCPSVCPSVRLSVRPSAVEHSCPVHNFGTV